MTESASDGISEKEAIPVEEGNNATPADTANSSNPNSVASSDTPGESQTLSGDEVEALTAAESPDELPVMPSEDEFRNCAQTLNQAGGEGNERVAYFLNYMAGQVANQPQ